MPEGGEDADGVVEPDDVLEMLELVVGLFDGVVDALASGKLVAEVAEASGVAQSPLPQPLSQRH